MTTSIHNNQRYFKVEWCQRKLENRLLYDMVNMKDKGVNLVQKLCNDMSVLNK